MGVAFGLAYRRTGWVHTVVVDRRWRGRGLGGALTAAVVDALRALGPSTIKLDATPLGRPVHRRLGFRPEHGVVTFEGEAAPPAPLPPGAGPLGAGEFPALLELDRRCFGDDRGKVLGTLAAEFPDLVAVRRGRGGEPSGFAMARPALRGHFLGPIVAPPGDLEGVVAMAALLVVRTGARRVRMYVPSLDRRASALPRALGLAPAQRTVRMRLGHDGAEAGIWAEASHAKG